LIVAVGVFFFVLSPVVEAKECRLYEDGYVWCRDHGPMPKDPDCDPSVDRCEVIPPSGWRPVPKCNPNSNCNGSNPMQPTPSSPPPLPPPPPPDQWVYDGPRTCDSRTYEAPNGPPNVSVERLYPSVIVI